MKLVALALSLAASMLVFVSVSDAAFYTVTMSGAAENPPNASPGTGSGFVDIDTGTHLLHVHVTFSGLLGITTASHVHCCTTPV